MKKFRFKLFINLLLLAGAVYFLYPTYSDYQSTQKIDETLKQKEVSQLKANPSLTKQDLDKELKQIEDSIRSSDPSIKRNRTKRVKLGLDLQGGMYVSLEVNTLKLLEKITKKNDDNFKQILKATEVIVKAKEEDVVTTFAAECKKKGVRLSFYFGESRDDDAKVLGLLKTQTDDAVKRAVEIIRNRIDQYGVAEPTIQTSGSRRVIVELPGVANEEEARQLLQGTALLEFKLVKDPEYTVAIMEKINKVLAGKPLDDSTKKDTNLTNTKDTTKKDVAKDTNTKKPEQMSQEEFAKEYPFYALAQLNPQSQTADAFVKDDNRVKIIQILERPDIQAIVPNDCQFLFSAKPDIVDKDNTAYYRMYCVKKSPELTGGVITEARANLDPTSSTPIVTMAMNNEGSRDWARITGSNLNKRIAVILDNAIFSAPVVRSKITGGNSQIEGMANLEEARLLEIVLKAGALPAPVDIMEERTVGPSLGQDSIKSGLLSGALGALLVVLFMIVYYRYAGWIADFAVVINVLFILAVMAGFNATLTLPGIAGIILTIGMAVDANILVNERIREEYDTGKTIKAAIESGYAKAFTAIFDANITTFITGLILYQFGTGPVQGFALTLMIGIVCTMYTALVITRLIFDISLEYGYSPKFG